MTSNPTPETNRMRALINDFAIRSFRDAADGDYIAARMALRARLIPQFLWSSLQAIEKYLKGILLINRIPSLKATHGVIGLLASVEAITKLRIRIANGTREFIQYVNDYGQFRYLERSYHANGGSLLDLDRAVWELRRYCAVLDYSQTDSDGTVLYRLEAELRRLKAAEANPRRFELFNGQLEKILGDPKHPARPGLIWNNLYYGRSKRRAVGIVDWFTSVNAPLSLNPEVFAEVRKYVYLPKAMIQEFEQLLNQRQEPNQHSRR